jgi:hypothetical protein
MLPFAASAFFNGELVGLFFVAVPVGAIALAAWTSHRTPETFLTLYADHLVESAHRGDEIVVRCDEIASIRWPAQGGLNVPIRVRFHDAEPGGSRTLYIKPSDATYRDRAILIGYLHVVAGHAAQDNWPEYCVRCAVPLLDSATDEAKDLPFGRHIGESASPFEKLVVPVTAWLSKYPLLLGLFAPLLGVGLLVVAVSRVSREVYWMTAAAISISAVINIRLVWGQWVAPFTEICFGFAAAMFVLGFLSTPRSARKDIQNVETVPYAAWFLLALIVGGPLLTNAAHARFVPNWFAKYVVLTTFYGMLILPMWLAARNRRKQLKIDAKPGSEPRKRWAAFEN